MPRISCITVCRNDKAGLLATVQSALAQTLPLYELLIIDGASTDGTKEELPEIIRQCEEKGIGVHAVSEPDTGIYNGMNKGIRAAAGDWLIFMNAGDVFSSAEVLQKMFAGAPQADMLYGDYRHIGSGVQCRASHAPDYIRKGMPGPHQCFFFRAAPMKECGYDEKYRICADYEYCLRRYLGGDIILHRSVEVCDYDNGGLSSVNSYPRVCENHAIRAFYGVGEPPVIAKAKECAAFLRQRLKQHSPK